MHIDFSRAVCGDFRGFGVQHDVFLYTSLNRDQGVTDEDIALVEDRVREMRPTVARVAVDIRWWNPSLDGETFEWDGEMLAGLQRVAELYREWDASLHLVVWRPLHFDGDQVENLASAVTALLSWLAEEGHDHVRYLTLFREPDQNFPPGWGVWRALVEAVHAAVSEHGLSVELVGPDIAGEEDQWIISTRDQLGEAISVYSAEEYNSYLEVESKRDDVYERIDERFVRLGREKPFVLGEFNLRGRKRETSPVYHPGFAGTGDLVLTVHAASLAMSGFLLECLRKGIGGMNYWCVHDMYYPDENGDPERMHYGLWGFKDSGWRVRPVYYAYRLFSRFGPAGTRVSTVGTGFLEGLFGGPPAELIGLTDGEGGVSVLVFYEGQDRGSFEMSLELRGLDAPAELRRYTFSPQSMDWIGEEERPPVEPLEPTSTVTLSGGKIEDTVAQRTVAVYTNLDE